MFPGKTSPEAVYMSYPFLKVFDRFPRVEFLTAAPPLDESFSFLTFSPMFKDLFYGVPFPRRDFHLLKLWSVEPALYGLFHVVFQAIPYDVVSLFHCENFFCPIRLITSVVSFLGSKYYGFLTFLDRDLFFKFFASFQGFR